MEPVSFAITNELPTRSRAPVLYAGFGLRVAASMVDMLIVGAMSLTLALYLGARPLIGMALWDGLHGTATGGFADAALQSTGLVVIIAWLYFAWCESSRWKATPGKLALGLVVTDNHGESIGFGRATGRHFGKWLSVLTLGIGFMMAGWTIRKQALHDWVAGCCVVREPGLVAWRGEQWTNPGSVPPGLSPMQTGVPGWAVALIVIAGCLLLVPVAAVVAGIALPAWQDHSIRAEVSEGIASTRRARALFAEYVGQRGALPRSNADLGLPRPEAIRARYVTSIRVTPGKLVVTYGNRADPAISGGRVVMSPVGESSMLQWRCSSPDIRDRYLPGNCH